MKRMVMTVLAAAVFAGGARAGGSGGIEGTLVDETGKVITGHVTITVACGSVRKTATTDGAGHFSISGLPDGACTLTTSQGTYVATQVGVSVPGNAIATVLVHVKSKAEWDREQAEAQRWQRQAAKPAPTRFGVGGGHGAMPRPMDLGKDEAEGDAPMAAPPMAASPPPAMHAPTPTRAHVASTPVSAAGKTPMPPPAPPAGNQPIAPKGKVVAALRAPLRLEPENKAAHAHAADRLIAAKKNMEIRADAGGWAAVRVFPVPMYTKAYDGPRDDFRETIYWNGDVQTSATGDAEVAFAASDAVTSFRATVEGFGANGLAGGGQATFQSKLPVTLDTHLPVEVTSGDAIRLPVTITNETDSAIDARLDAKFGAAFALANNPITGPMHLKAHDKQSVVFPLQIVATDGSGDVDIELTTRGLHDELKKTIRVVPRGFPFEASASGTARNGATSHHTVDLAGALPGSIHATVTMYASPVAAMTEGMAAMIREPGGCFEQTSSTNYPNIMVLSYLENNEAADPSLVESARGKLDHGYKLLTGYETPEKGYEWFGHTPGHEALTAYGLMEFADMAKVYDVDKKMVERTADWLMTRRDHKGGFMRSSEALDSFGRAGEATTNAYIMWALAEAKRTGNLGQELDTQLALGRDTKDPYLVALAANTALATSPKSGDAAGFAARLAAMQDKDGSFTGAKETITKSGGDSLTIETTALATLALLKASPNNEYEPQIRNAVDWLNGKRGGYGAWGNTQATILGLKALTAYSEHARQMQSGGKATLVINGKDAGTIEFDKGRRDALVWNDTAMLLAPGKNTIELRLDGPTSLPYSIAIDYRSDKPQTSPRAKIDVSTQLLKTHVAMGEGVTLRAHVENKTNAGVPMTLARIGLPGGTVFQTWQLKELRDKGLIDFYETRPREVILYWRALPPSAKKDVDLNLLAQTPGTYEAPASSAYLYYTAEDKTWTKSVAITIDR
jgi:hypothetical protein